MLNKRIALAFHGIYSGSMVAHPLDTSRIMSSIEFENVIKWLKKRYRFLTFDEYIKGKKGVLVTFDDGYANTLTEALPILERHSIPAIVFVTCDHINERQNHSRMSAVPYPPCNFDEVSLHNHYFDGLTQSQLLELHNSPLIEIGNHTFHHKDLANLDPPEIKSEIESANDFIERITGSLPRLFAYPFGSFSNTYIQVLIDLGYEYGFALENGVTKGNNLIIKRFGIYHSDRLYLTCKLSILFRVVQMYKSIKYKI